LRGRGIKSALMGLGNCRMRPQGWWFRERPILLGKKTARRDDFTMQPTGGKGPGTANVRQMIPPLSPPSPRVRHLGCRRENVCRAAEAPQNQLPRLQQRGGNACARYGLFKKTMAKGKSGGPARGPLLSTGPGFCGLCGDTVGQTGKNTARGGKTCRPAFPNPFSRQGREARGKLQLPRGALAGELHCCTSGKRRAGTRQGGGRGRGLRRGASWGGGHGIGSSQKKGDRNRGKFRQKGSFLPPGFCRLKVQL